MNTAQHTGSADHGALHEQAKSWPGVNGLAAPLAAALVSDAQRLRIVTEKSASGATIIDAGIDAPGGLEAGRRIAELCLGGLGQVSLTCGSPFRHWPWLINVHTANPVLACLGSQYAGWSLAHGEGKGSFHALGSGPGRALAAKEALFAELGYRDRAERASLVLEVDKRPPPEIIDKVVRDCGIQARDLTLVLTPTTSVAGTAQIVARVLEVALHKAHTLGFALARVVDGLGSAPLPPPSGDFLTAMGRTNDAILFGGGVHLFVTGPDEDAQLLSGELSCVGSRDYGKPFAQIFKDYKFDFYQIDPHLFAPALVAVTALKSGRTFRGGRYNEELLNKSFGDENGNA
jgi:methenyltetrahydromethanopterin cyclohydrolase